MRKRSDLPKYVYAMGRSRYLYFRRHTLKLRMPDDPASAEFKELYEKLCAEAAKVPNVYVAQAVNNNQVDQLFEKLERGAKQRAKKAGREYSLPKYWGADAYVQQKARCAITGLIMRRPVRPWDAYGPSIDRKDSALGYTPENCQLTILAVNRAKNEMSDSDFLTMCAAVVNNSAKRIVNGT